VPRILVAATADVNFTPSLATLHGAHISRDLGDWTRLSVPPGEWCRRRTEPGAGGGVGTVSSRCTGGHLHGETSTPRPGRG